VLGQGEKTKMLTSSALSTLYGAPVKLTQKEGKYALRVL
jgi:hypothetical protein